MDALIWRRVVAMVAVFGLGVLGCLGGLPGAAAAARRAPLVLRLKWRPVAHGSTVVATNDRYAVIVGGAGGVSHEITLIDEQTGAQLALSPPDCPAPGNEGSPMFGGPWLMFSCGPDAYQLYDLGSGQWVSFTPSPQCGHSGSALNGMCVAVGVGSDWVKLITTFGCEAHCSASYYLQNIVTGDLVPDPITPDGTTFDDLNSRSGSVPLCRPLRYPTSGVLQFSGPFVLVSGVTYHLERCGSRLDLRLPDANPGPDAIPPLLRSRAVVSLGSRQEDHCKKGSGLVCTVHYLVRGRYLPGLQEFTASLPKTAVPQYASPGEVVGLTRQTIYVEAPGEQVWAATLPSPTTSGATSRCVRVRIGRNRRCLAVGRRCSNKYEHIYRRHGFTCSSRRRLRRRRVGPPGGGSACSGNGTTAAQAVAAPASPTSMGTTTYTTVIPSTCVGPSGYPGDFSAVVINDANGQVDGCLTGSPGPPPGQLDCPSTAQPGRMGGDDVGPPSFERGPVNWVIVLRSAYTDGGQLGGTLGSAHVLYRW